METKSSIIKEKEPFQGFPYRKWSVEVKALGSESESWPLEKWVEKVEFKLHESFENPLKTFTEPPFKVEEIGWGEFRMEITIYSKDEISPPVSFLHDLAFQPESFEKTHVITLRPKPTTEAVIETLVGPSFVEEGGEKENDLSGGRKKRKSFGRGEDASINERIIHEYIFNFVIESCYQEKEL